jgi:hypothetical protein
MNHVIALLAQEVAQTGARRQDIRHPSHHPCLVNTAAEARNPHDPEPASRFGGDVGSNRTPAAAAAASPPAGTRRQDVHGYTCLGEGLGNRSGRDPGSTAERWILVVEEQNVFEVYGAVFV